MTAIKGAQGLAALVCLLLALVAGKWGLADFYARQSLDTSLAWSNESISLASWRDAVGSLETALTLDSSHPVYHHQMGRLLHVGMGLADDPDARADSVTRSAVHYQRSIAERPAWAVTSASLALMKADARQFDAEFHQAIADAAAAGPWEPGVLQMLGGIGARGLIFQPQATQALLVQNMGRGLVSPVAGTARVMLAHLKSHPVFDYPVLAAGLGQILTSQDWDRWRQFRLPTFTEASLLLWAHWPADVRPVLGEQIAANLNDRRVERLVQAYELWPEICPYIDTDTRRFPVCFSIESRVPSDLTSEE